MGLRNWLRRFVEIEQPGSLAEQLRDWSRQAALAARSERVADPGGEIARRYQIIEGHLAEGRAAYPEPGEALSTLLAAYKARYGTETVLDSQRAVELRAAVLNLVRRMNAVPLPPAAVDNRGRTHLLVAVRYVDTVADYVLDRVREPGQ